MRHPGQRAPRYRFSEQLYRSRAPIRVHPHRAACVFPGSAKYRIKTGSIGEGYLLIGLLFMLLVFMPILQMGGIWQSFRYLMATPSAAYANYRKADTETVLTFEGRWRHTREHVRGEGVILDARPALFWIIFKGLARPFITSN